MSQCDLDSVEKCSFISNGTQPHKLEMITFESQSVRKRYNQVYMINKNHHFLVRFFFKFVIWKIWITKIIRQNNVIERTVSLYTRVMKQTQCISCTAWQCMLRLKEMFYLNIYKTDWSHSNSNIYFCFNDTIITIFIHLYTHV